MSQRIIFPSHLEKNLGRLPIVEIDKNKLSWEETAIVTFRISKNLTYTMPLFIEGIELTGYSTGGDCPTLVAFTRINTGRTLVTRKLKQKKEYFLAPVANIMSYQPLEPKRGLK